MHPDYHSSLIESGIVAVKRRAQSEAWADIAVERDGGSVFVSLTGALVGDEYLAKIDMSRYPVEPYEVGFIRPGTNVGERNRVSDRDVRYWPWSPMPGLHGSFHIHFHRAIRAFWCRDCTASFFYFHGHEIGRRWQPSAWPLDYVVATLRTAVRQAVHPRHWRPVQRANLIGFAAQRGVVLPENAGLDDS